VIRNILVPVDGSPLGERALPYAGMLAQALKCPVTLLRVLDLPSAAIFIPLGGYTSGEFWQSLIDAERQQAEAYLQRLAEDPLLTDLEVVTRTEGFGVPAAHIIDIAAELAPTLIVMATHGRGGLERWALGSVAEKVVRSGVASVWLVPAFAETSLPVRRLLVPLDESPLAAAILPLVGEIASKIEANIVLLETIAMDSHAEPGLENQARIYLAKQAKALEQRNLLVETTVQYGDPAAAILRYAHHHAIDAIAMATHGRSGLSRWAFGSVADKVLHGTTLPLLLYRPPMDVNRDLT
jgi:nucleotide-binding universal stress UspA family protein